MSAGGEGEEEGEEVCDAFHVFLVAKDNLQKNNLEIFMVKSNVSTRGYKFLRIDN